MMRVADLPDRARRRSLALVLLVAYVLACLAPTAEAARDTLAGDAWCPATHCHDEGGEGPSGGSDPCEPGNECCKCPCHAQAAIAAASSATAVPAPSHRGAMPSVPEQPEDGEASPPETPPKALLS